jgi:hypothetical protein
MQMTSQMLSLVGLTQLLHTFIEMNNCVRHGFDQLDRKHEHQCNCSEFLSNLIALQQLLHICR